MALNTMCPTKRSQVTCNTGTAFTVTRYFAVASSPAKQIVASTMSPIAFSSRRGSAMAAVGRRRGVIGQSICTSLCQKAMRR